MDIQFTKMHGAGNDYIYINTLLYQINEPEALARKWSDRHKGIGADGLVLIGAPDNPEEADFSMRIFNADGSEAMMCGNASRCIGKYLYEKGLTDKTEIKLQTRSGVKTLWLKPAPASPQRKSKRIESVTVDMGCPRFDVPEQYIPKATEIPSMFVSMGNPHFVVFVDDLSQIDVADDGSILENDERFPERCNIEFAQIISSSRGGEEEGVIRTRVWERGSGVTLACGTGACATAVAAIHTGRITGRRCLVRMDGGDLQVEWCAADHEEGGRHHSANHVYLTGPAAFVFDGMIEEG